MKLTVKQLSQTAGISIRTLHYYDEIGLLHPAETGKNGYRYYHEANLLRLQQIMFYKELGLPLEKIGEILDDPHFDTLQALQEHKVALQQKFHRIQSLIATVENTIKHVEGEKIMTKHELFKGFSSKEEERKVQQEAEKRYNPELVKQSYRNWNSYSDDEKTAIMDRGNEIFRKIAESMEQGIDSPAVQEQVDAYFQYINTYYYDCSLEIFRGLGSLYVDSPDFRANFDKMHPDLAPFCRDAFAHYCDAREK
ncbi:MAG: MerR family transcriptional regulator [Candidatus Marinimicrobia bacterium]|nr:MerR family transcriptional regulator [Candidatus Neomarinimicrobiota bacterium]